MNKHTPGPWEVGFGDGVSGSRAAPSAYWDETDTVELPIRHGGEVVCWLASASETEKEMRPDAHLIAAAPDMLEALRAIADHHVEINTKALRPLDHSKTLRIALAAIAKAEGRKS